MARECVEGLAGQSTCAGSDADNKGQDSWQLYSVWRWGWGCLSTFDFDWDLRGNTMPDEDDNAVADRSTEIHSENPVPTADTTTSPDLVSHAVAMASRRVAEFTVLVAVSILFFMRGPFWHLPAFFRWVMALVAAGCVFLVYVGILGWSSRRRSRDQENGDSESDRSYVTRVFRVPRNFGVRTIVLATLGFAVLTSVLKSIEVSPTVMLIVLVFVTAICCMQMFMNKVPRFASALVGLVMGIVLATLYHQEMRVYFSDAFRRDFELSMFFGVFLGTLGGYATGALIAGIFLFTDAVIDWWTTSSVPEPSVSASSADALGGTHPIAHTPGRESDL